jgi:hypothetical protein
MNTGDEAAILATWLLDDMPPDLMREERAHVRRGRGWWR